MKELTLKQALQNAVEFYQKHAEEQISLSEEVKDDKERYEHHIFSAKLYEGKSKGFAEALEYVQRYLG